MLKMLVRQATRSVAEALLAGGAVHRRALVAGAAAGHAGTAARRSALRVRCAPDELMERAVVGTFLGALGQGLRVDRLEPGAAIRIHDGHDDLGTARHVKDDPVELRSARGDLDELSWEYWIHGVSVPATSAFDREREATDQALLLHVALRVRLDPRDLARVVPHAPRGALLGLADRPRHDS